MASAKKSTDHPAPDAPELVQLKCDDLGIESQGFTPAHAKALLALQAAKGYAHWQPLDTPKTDA